MHKFINTFLLYLLILFPSLAQEKASHHSRIAKVPQSKGQFADKTVVFKIKPDIREHISNPLKRLKLLGKLYQEINITSFTRLLPAASTPQKTHNHLGQLMVDLSLIYKLTYSGNYTVDQVVDKMKRTGLVSYAEPFYINEILYVPNDPFADSATAVALGGSNYYFEYMKYFKALDLSKGDTNVVIGVIDTDIKWDHEDLVDNIKYNYADPINGADDDGDGYIDNFRGWDVGMNDNDPTGTNGHGTQVAGCASATADNGKGVPGIGFKCKLLPIKAAYDGGSAAIPEGFAGVTYAADHNCKVINLSWGGAGNYSSLAQDVINYAAINKDAVVVAAAGNSGKEENYYPASYDNVLSVVATQLFYHAGLDTIVDIRADFGTYSHYADIGAPGRKITSCVNTGGYYSGHTGSSFASPLVAGAAGLVRSRYPALSGLQVAELLRVTADPLIDTIPLNSAFKQEKMGKGRLNIYKALTDSVTPAIRMYHRDISNKVSPYAFSGDTVLIRCKFRNYLRPTVNATATITVVTDNAKVTEGSFTLGAMKPLDSLDNNAAPFKIVLDNDLPLDTVVMIRIGFSDPAKGYSDFQYFEFNINPSYINIDTNQITLTVSSNGRIGFIDPEGKYGAGFQYMNNPLLYEGGLMLATGPARVMDCVRGAPAGNMDEDFHFTSIQKYVKLPEGDQGARTILTDIGMPDSVGVVVEQRSYAYKNAPDDKYVIIEYLVRNVSGKQLDTLYLGLFNDFDVIDYTANKAAWDSQDSIGYTYYPAAGGIYAGVCLLTPQAPSCFSMDNYNAGGNNINPNDGFTSFEKYKTLSQGIARPTAGGSGGDVSQVVGARITDFKNNEQRTIAFALVAGDNLNDLKSSARKARNTFRFYNTSPLPAISSFDFCKGNVATVTIAPANGSMFNFYTSSSATTPAHTGSSYTIPDLSVSDTLYVKGIDSIFEGPAAPARIIFHDELSASYSFVPKTVDLSVNSFAYFVNTSKSAALTNWDMGDGNTYANTNEVLHKYTTPGTYKVLLTAFDQYQCTDTISHFVKVIGPTAIHPSIPGMNDGIALYPNPVKDRLNIQMEFNTPYEISIRIINALGQTITYRKASNVLHENLQFLLEGQEKGMYYAQIEIGEKMITKKFAIE